MIIAFIQARMSSTRLPGKVLRQVGGLPMVHLIVERLKASRKIDKVMVLTSTDSSDDELVEYLVASDVLVFRGELDDVLSRFAQAASVYPADLYIRVTADCPFVDPLLIDELIDSHVNQNADYSSNALSPNLPDGFDAEAFSKQSLLAASTRATKAHEREHVTYYLYSSGKFKVNSFEVNGQWQRPNYRLTVDNPEDLEFINRIISSSGLDPVKCSYQDLIRFLDEQDSAFFINSFIQRNEGLAKSLSKSLQPLSKESENESI